LLIGGTLIYAAVGYLVRPEPNFDNTGIAGGLIDHPGRYSDDINRELIGANVLLGPGRFIAESLVDFVLLWQRKAGHSEDDDAIWDSPQSNAICVEDRLGDGDQQRSDLHGLGRG
jgi:hypothetical protein